MSYIRISNESFFDKEYYSTFAKQNEYRFFNVGSSISTLVPKYKELIKEAIGNKANETFKDYELPPIDTSAIKNIFERELEIILEKINLSLENDEPVNKVIEWKGVEYLLNLSLTNPNNRIASDYYDIISICKECLAKNKSMYLSIQ
ncbi:hypothetical protein [Pseudotenacibaculum haliotis]|uniref:Uncharacterized protein n=1 Tax=Pseudotenacibaculum haliotis TaxID=1862138 RepID=A0ABW5LWL2_9FLAO